MIQNLYNLAKQHAGAVLCAILIGLSLGMPGLFSTYSLGEEYHGVPLLFQDSEYLYLSRIREITEGHYGVTSPVFHEYKKGFPLIPPFGEGFYALIYAPLSLFVSLTTFVLGTKFVIPAILFLLTYGLVFRLLADQAPSIRRVASLVGGLLFVFGSDFLELSRFISIATWQWPALYLSIWTRLVNPWFGAFCILIFLHALLSLEDNHKSRSALLLGFIALLLSSGYLFSFLFLMAFCSVYLALLLIQGRRKMFAKLALVYAPFLFASCAVLFALYGDILNIEPMKKLGLFFTHLPTQNNFLMAVAVVGAVMLALRRERGVLHVRELFAISFVLGGLLSFSQQLVTGITVWPQHLVQYTVPLGMIALLLLSFGLRLRPRLWNYAGVLSIAIFSVFVLGGVVTMVRYAPEAHLKVQNLGAAVDSLSKEKSPCVALVIEDFPERLNLLVPSLTSCDVAISDWVYTAVPDERILHNAIIAFRLRGLTTEEVAAYLEENPGYVAHYFFRDWKELFYEKDDRFLLRISDRDEIRRWIREVSQHIVRSYEAERSVPLRTLLRRYRVDFVLVDANIPVAAEFLESGEVSSIKPLGAYTMYTVSKKPSTP